MLRQHLPKNLPAVNVSAVKLIKRLRCFVCCSRPPLFLCVFMAAILIAAAPLSVKAQTSGTSLLLDAEVDDYVNALAKPVLKSAHLSPEDVHILILNSPEINAFVNSQRAVFLMSGLILEAENANEVRGVIAHEIGHLKGHHLLRGSQNRSNLTLSTILGGILGVGAMAAGAPQAGSAVLVGSQAAGISSLLKFSRSQEQQADQIAVKLLHELNISNEGLKSFFGRLNMKQQIQNQAPPAYLLTHPTPANREKFLAANISKSFHPSAAERKKFKRVKAKVQALTLPPGKTRRRLFDDETGFADYARTIAFLRAGQFEHAQQSLAQAQKKLNLKEDAYVTEMRGHIALEKGNTEKAERFFAQALTRSPKSTLIRYHYGRTLLINHKTQKAIAQLERVLSRHGQWWMAHQQIGMAYGKAGQKVASRIHLAQAALYHGKGKDAAFHLNTAEKLLTEATTKKQKQQQQTIDLIKHELEKQQN